MNNEDNAVLHEADEAPSLMFRPHQLYSLLDILGGGTATCDRCGRWQRFSALTPTLAKEQLAAHGWQSIGDEDVCPKCAAAGERK